uniref:TLC domain-containing protein n=1 Tax=Haptolina brevifila TaxID=156173 RepID=A0A7S2GE23_9EUKA
MANLWHWNEWSGGTANVIHHIIAIILYAQILEGGYGHYMGISAWLLEATTPFINQRWFFAMSKMDHGLVYKINGALMVLLWLLLRIIFCGWGFTAPGTVQIAQLPAPRAISMYFGFFGGYLLQWFWGYKLLRGLLKVLGVIGGKKNVK